MNKAKPYKPPKKSIGWSYRAGEAFLMLRAQPCFGRLADNEIRREMRDCGAGQAKYSPPFSLSGMRPAICPDWVRPRTWLDGFVIQNQNWVLVRRFTLEDVFICASSLPFECPRCASTQNPFKELGKQQGVFDFVPDGNYICKSCHKNRVPSFKKHAAELTTIIKQLNRG
jgi:hypothetical protein